ncbi:HK97 family phage prohead protease, partial [Nostoc linckia]
MPPQQRILAERRDMPAMQLRAAVVPSSVNDENRTVRLEYTTGAAVRRYGYFQGSWTEYMEELSLEHGHVKLDRLKNGAPLLDSHRSWGLDSVLGVVEAADERFATVRFSERDEVNPIWADVKTGIIRNVSVGYVVNRFEDVTKPDDKIRRLRAIDWEPFEISLVSVPADPKAGVRSAVETSHCVIVGQPEEGKEEKPEMPPEERQQPSPAPASAPDNTALQTALAAERQRIAAIQKICRDAKLPDTFSQRLIDENTTVESAAETVKALGDWVKQDEAPNNNQVRILRDATDTRVERVSSFLLQRSNQDKYKITEETREFVGMSLFDLGRQSLEIAGLPFKGESR